jgi:hypothetical protein
MEAAFMRREPSHERAETRRWRQEIAQTNLSYDQKLPDSLGTAATAQGKTGLQDPCNQKKYYLPILKKYYLLF